MKKRFLGTESLADKMRRVHAELNEEKPLALKEEKLPEKKPEPKVIIKADPKLFVSGRLDRKNHKYISRSLVLLNNLEEEIKVYCRGGDLVILNYLIKEGLRKVKESESSINIDMTDIENK